MSVLCPGFKFTISRFRSRYFLLPYRRSHHILKISCQQLLFNAYHGRYEPVCKYAELKQWWINKRIRPPTPPFLHPLILQFSPFLGTENISEHTTHFRFSLPPSLRVPILALVSLNKDLVPPVAWQLFSNSSEDSVDLWIIELQHPQANSPSWRIGGRNMWRGDGSRCSKYVVLLLISWGW